MNYGSSRYEEADVLVGGFDEQEVREDIELYFFEVYVPFELKPFDV
jgi:hypothetical protein